MKNLNWQHDDSLRPYSRPQRFPHKNSHLRLLSQDYNHLAQLAQHDGGNVGSEAGKLPLGSMVNFGSNIGEYGCCNPVSGWEITQLLCI